MGTVRITTFWKLESRKDWRLLVSRLEKAESYSNKWRKPISSHVCFQNLLKVSGLVVSYTVEVEVKVTQKNTGLKVIVPRPPKDLFILESESVHTMEPVEGLNLTIWRSQPELKPRVRCLTDYATLTPLKVFLRKVLPKKRKKILSDLTFSSPYTKKQDN